MIKEDVPIYEVNCGEGYWHFFYAEKHARSKVRLLAWELKF